MFLLVKIVQKAGQIRCIDHIDPSGHTAKVASQRAGQAALRCFFCVGKSEKQKLVHFHGNSWHPDPTITRSRW